MDFIFIDFFSVLRSFPEIDPPYRIVFCILFLAGGGLEYFLLRRGLRPWLLPAVLLVLEIFCEWFYQIIHGFDALLFAIVGASCLFALLGTAAVFLIFLIFHHNR